MPSRIKVLMLFLDGVGIGRNDDRTNPFFAFEMRAMKKLLGGNMPHLRDAHVESANVSLRPINATLGVPGLPQSGTGQTALFTGVNAAKMIGKHFGPYPYSSLKSVIKEKNIFHSLHESGKNVHYANAFPKQFFEYINSGRTRTTATTMAWISSGFELNDSKALAAGRALSSDITSERWNSLGYPRMPVISPQQAGRKLVEFTNHHDFVLFEYFLTDHAGHSQSMDQAKCVLEKVDGLLEGIVESMDVRTTLVVVTSDHGNLEDLSTKSHTRNPVPLLAIGASHKKFTTRCTSLTHVTPAIINLLE